MPELDGLWWLLITMAPLLIVQRRLHQEIQAVFLLLTRSQEISLALFSVLFLPGVLLHEVSHYLVARMVGVRTGRFSLTPRTMSDGRLQLGYVETVKADPIRDAVIGSAPLLAGGAFVAYIGIGQLQLLPMWAQIQASGSYHLEDLLNQFWVIPDLWLWLYLAFAISSTMTPSQSDRKAWTPVLLVVGLLLAASLIAGGGPWLVENLSQPLNQAFKAVSFVFGFSLAVQMVVLIPAWLARRGLNRITGLEVVGSSH
jgi:hypothetical protein